LIAGITCTSPSCSRPGRQQIAGPDPTEDCRPQPNKKFKEIKLFNSQPGFLIPISSRAPRRQQETGGGGGGERTPSPEHTPQCDSPSALGRLRLAFLHLPDLDHLLLVSDGGNRDRHALLPTRPSSSNPWPPLLYTRWLPSLASSTAPNPRRPPA